MTQYYNKPSFLKRMGRLAKQERQERERKEKEKQQPEAAAAAAAEALKKECAANPKLAKCKKPVKKKKK